MEAVQLLTTQHREMERALAGVLEAKDPGERQNLFEKAADHLTMHIASEEEVFYPAVKARRTEDILLESLEEHLSLKRLMADLNELDATDKTWEAKFKVLKEQAEHHHKEEEEHLFPKVLKLLSDEQRLDLADEMCKVQRRLGAAGDPRELVADETDEAAPLR